jgi:hypothetical protein
MRNTITFFGRAMSLLMAAAVVSSLAANPAKACQMFGPYATMRRANEVANEARGYGYSAVAFHNGNGYYVRVC